MQTISPENTAEHKGRSRLPLKPAQRRGAIGFIILEINGFHLSRESIELTDCIQVNFTARGVVKPEAMVFVLTRRCASNRKSTERWGSYLKY